MKKILVVGGVAGGASFAARMRRLDETAQIIMFEKGEYISFANCGLPYHIGETIKNRDALLISKPEQFSERFRVDVRIKSEVTAINTVKKAVTVKSDRTIYEESYDYLVLSPGAEPVRPPVAGINSRNVHTLRTLPDMDLIKEKVDSGKIRRVAVIGGGFIGLEMTENLRHRGLEVVQIELMDQVFAPADREMAQILHQHLQINGIRLLLENGARAFADREDGTLDITLNNGEILNVDMAILAIGVRPDTSFVKKAGIEVNERGAIIVDKHMRTNIKDIYAVGDAVEVTDLVSGQKVHIPLAGPANRQGRIVADNISGKETVYKNTQGTAICKVFDLTAAVSGINEKTAKKLGIAYLKSYTHSSSHAGYYPGSYPMSIKILFAPDNGRLLGAQVIGKLGVDKRIDIFATAIRHGLTVHDLAELELAYAPPYGNARDAVNIAGFVAENILNNTSKVVYPEDIERMRKNCTLLDVRSEIEHEQGSISGSLVIPLEQLRDRLDELDKGKPVLVYCQIGLRGYIAARILTQNGFEAYNLSGGYKTFTTFSDSELDTKCSGPVSKSLCSSPDLNRNTIGATVLIDACGLQCPGPIMKLKETMDKIQEGETVQIKATEQGFVTDIPSWCSRTGNPLLSLSKSDGVYTALVKKGSSLGDYRIEEEKKNSKTIVVFSNDFDKMMAAFIIANGAAAMGAQVTMFFTFWGLNLLRRNEKISVKKSIVEKMFGLMMPRGASKVKLSKMHMAGMGTFMIQQIMKHKNVYSLSRLIDEARKNGIKFVACSMSMDIMGIKKEELIDGVEIGGVATYLEKADQSNYNLFI
jgi:NADPH-dependent 2,4-dienoyl-CoA reductase/sulfur reductase-like enzyme/peroxiredoxin family protein/TusA-related sulfurtransferase/rhodanese-related sulfurtransferase